MIEDDEVSVRWYSNNGSLIIKGEKANGLQSRLLFRVDRGKERWAERSVSEMLLLIITVNLVIFILTRQTTLIHPKTNAARITLTSRALENLSKKLEYHMRNNIKSLTDEIDKINGNY